MNRPADPVRDMVYEIQEYPRLVAHALAQDVHSLERCLQEFRKPDPSYWVIKGYINKACEKYAEDLLQDRQ